MRGAGYALLSTWVARSHALPVRPTPLVCLAPCRQRSTPLLRRPLWSGWWAAAWTRVCISGTSHQRRMGRALTWWSFPAAATRARCAVPPPPFFRFPSHLNNIQISLRFWPHASSPPGPGWMAGKGEAAANAAIAARHYWGRLAAGKRTLAVIASAMPGPSPSCSHVPLRCHPAQVTAVDFHQQTQQMASAGGVVNTVWDFSGEGPAGTMPTVCVGHGKPITCQVRLRCFRCRSSGGGGGGGCWPGRWRSQMRASAPTYAPPAC